jgi:hypothetical protein
LTTLTRGKDVFVQRIMWRVIALGAGTAAAGAVRAIATAAWRTTRHEDPPTNPAARGVRWRDALIWAISVAAGAAVARVVAERGAASAWEAATGSPPPGLET